MTWGGGIGAGFAALCCFTGRLPLVLGAVGSGMLTGALYRDSVLPPVLGLWLIVMGAGLWLQRQR
ncbi:MAG: hypothetical protein CVT70_14530 [Alphaproteobacteria bacterium HGW-Alphaproteobacteria-1]|jgi:mercuric ion transport protein|nr:MAG: hypothetical protein CVT70_14530 [Alphaproteobacteria bacterium HGW-Alphaproteobacteria-1]